MSRVVVAAAVLTPALVLGGTAAASAPGTDNVPCSIAIVRFQQPTGVNGLRLVLGRIWLPKRTLALGRARAGWDRFAKVGIEVRAGDPVVLELPRKWRGRYALEYAPKHVQTVADGSTRLTIQACADELGTWSTYAGGYVVKRPLCVPLIVQAGGRATTVHVPIGRSCKVG